VDPPCCLPGTLPAWGDHRGSCPSGRRSCPLASGACCRLQLWAAVPVSKTSDVVRCEDPTLSHGGFSLTRRPRFTPRKISWYSFLLKAE
jgi:hypothetical protein